MVLIGKKNSGKTSFLKMGFGDEIVTSVGKSGDKSLSNWRSSKQVFDSVEGFDPVSLHFVIDRLIANDSGAVFAVRSYGAALNMLDVDRWPLYGKRVYFVLLGEVPDFFNNVVIE